MSSELARIACITAEQLPEHMEAWEEVARHSLAPNVFYEPLMLLPALKCARNAQNLRFLLIYGPESLWGFFPLEFQTRCLGLPLRALAFWQHRFCYLTTPLLHRDFAAQALSAFWRWFERNPLGIRILDTNWLLADGAFHAAWTEFAIGRDSVLLNDFPRAFFRPSERVPDYLAQVVSHKSRNEFQRRERRLAGIGRLEYQVVETAEEASAWADDFLRLEAMGWKGTEERGRAFANFAVDSEYFREITRTGFEQNRVLLLSLTLNNQPIAMRHTLLSGGGSYAFRTAYDEHYAKYSPGLLLELETMRCIEAHPEIRWMDSCAAPRHPLFTRIWRERRMVRRTLFSNGSAASDLLVCTLPLLRWIAKSARPRPTPDYLQISTQLKCTEVRD